MHDFQSRVADVLITLKQCPISFFQLLAVHCPNLSSLSRSLVLSTGGDESNGMSSRVSAILGLNLRPCRVGLVNWNDRKMGTNSDVAGSCLGVMMHRLV